MSALAALSMKLQINVPSGKMLVALIPLFVVLGGLIVYCLIDLIRSPSVRYLPKSVWALGILLGSAPFGPIAYLVFGKDRSDRRLADRDVQPEDRTAEPAESDRFVRLGG